ncbi:Metallo-hydrolase/oxidoreductase [Thozetella sp. PMI_491]|nr:Metallo-hydrolase/oxidoreductase [Thozetella sp. PMI_491]
MEESLVFPASENTVRVRAIDTTTNMVVNAEGFVHPVLQGLEGMNLTTMAFLVKNDRLGKTTLFDCGGSKDFHRFSPAVRHKMDKVVAAVQIEKDVDEILQEAGIDLQSLDCIVWSHWHWDHHGAPDKFPKNVDIVVGPGFKDLFMPGFPTRPDAILPDKYFEGRQVQEIGYSASPLRIGQFPAYDFFGDGSFYLLDSPGHAVGHMCGLARTTANSFVFMGGDICHFPGSFRPLPKFPLPDPVPAGQLDSSFPVPCPCSVFTHMHPSFPKDDSRTSPFFDVSRHAHSTFLDRDAAAESIQRMRAFEESDDVLVCIAHDPSLIKVLPLLNADPTKDINDWKMQQYKEKSRWGWLNEMPRDAGPGRPPLVDGRWWQGQKIDKFTDAIGGAPQV